MIKTKFCNITLCFISIQESNRSLAVRMALGETQIVAETRQFLLDNGVALDSFSQVKLRKEDNPLEHLQPI